MANYTEGTVTITDGSAIVVGEGTRWATRAKAGRCLTVAGLNLPYQIGRVLDDTTLQLVKPISITGVDGTDFSLTGQSYSIVDSFTPNLSVPIVTKDDIDKQPRLVRGFTIIDQAVALVIGWEIMTGIRASDGSNP